MRSLLWMALLSWPASASPTGSLTQLSERYGCAFPDDTRRIQCVMGMVRVHCAQERLNLRYLAGASKSDPAVSAFDSCLGGAAADPFESELSSWAAAEVYLERGLSLLDGRDAAAGAAWVRTVPSTGGSPRPADGVEGIRAVCATQRARRDELAARLADASLSPGVVAEVNVLLSIGKALTRCDTIVKNGWGSAVGYPIFLSESLDLAEALIRTGAG